MAKQTINIGASPNDGTGTPLRTAFDYTNQNFTELYTATGPSGNNIVVPGSATITGDLTVDSSTLKVDSANDRVGINTATPANTLEVVAPAGDNIVSTFRSGDATAANNAGGGFRSISSATAANRVAQVWLDADGANFSGGDYFFIQKNGGSGTVEFNQSSNAAMVFLTNSTEQMRLNSTGLGVGVVPSAGKFEVGIGAGTTTPLFRFLGNSGSWNGQFNFDASGNLQAYSYNGTKFTDFVWPYGNVGIGVTPSAWTTSYNALNIGSGGSIAAYKSANYDQLYVGSNFFENTSGAWRFINNGYATQYWHNSGSHVWRISTTSNAAGANQPLTWTQAMTLDASGRLFVGATSIAAGYSGNNYLIVGGVASPTIKLQSTTGPAAWDIYSAGGLDLFIAYNSSDKGQFSTTTGAYTALSDANKKRDFEPSNIGLAEVLRLQPKLFRMIDDSDDAPKQLGFVAQDVQSVIPQAYAENEGQGGKFIGLQDRPIIAAITRAIQELAARVQTLETR